MTVAEKALEFALNIANDDTHGYDQANRTGPDYDCSMLGITAYESAGVHVKAAGATYTGNMYKAFTKCKFIDVTRDVNLKTGEGLKPGDVLLVPNKHTVMFVKPGMIVHASINEKRTTRGGKTGDQTGREICTRTYYNKPWTYVLRYVGDEPKLTVTELAHEVMAGKWGVGNDRKKRITNAGYDYEEVRKEVNRLVGIQNEAPTQHVIHTVKKGDTLSKLAKKYNTTVNKIVEDNRNTYPKITASYIVVGWKLKV